MEVNRIFLCVRIIIHRRDLLSKWLGQFQTQVYSERYVNLGIKVVHVIKSLLIYYLHWTPQSILQVAIHNISKLIPTIVFIQLQTNT